MKQNKSKKQSKLTHLLLIKEAISRTERIALNIPFLGPGQSSSKAEFNFSLETMGALIMILSRFESGRKSLMYTVDKIAIVVAT